MASKVTLTDLPNYKEKKLIKPDADGYYRILVGKYNVFTRSGGAFTPSEPIENLVFGDTFMAEALATGKLAGEANHPDFKGMTHAEQLTRNNLIDKARKSHHIRNVELIKTDIPSKFSGFPNEVHVYAHIKPEGVYGDALRAELDNPNTNVCFSARAMSVPNLYIRGVKIHKNIALITWDWVHDQNIAGATTHGTMGLVTNSNIEPDIDTLIELSKDTSGKVTNDNLIIIKQTITSFQAATKSSGDVFTKW